MHVILKLAVVVSLSAVLAACENKSNGGPDGTPDSGTPGGGPNEEAQANKVTGQAFDTQGRPLANAVIYVGGVDVSTAPRRGTTNAEGRYTVDGMIEQLGYKAYGWLPLNYRGKDFCLLLEHENPSQDGPFIARDGAVRNFRWKLQGRISDSTADPETDSAWFGGGMRLFPELADGDYTNSIELQLTPTGPLIDGSQGQPLTRTVDLTKAHFAVDIPVGPYKITATLLKDGSRIPLRLGPSMDALSSELAFEFEPETFPACGSKTASSGVKRAFLYLARQ